jgi:hypothetical protein
VSKLYTITMRSRAAGLALALGIVGVGALVLFLGFALLATLTIGGVLLGTGAAAYRLLRGGRRGVPQQHFHSGLDPALEVRPPSRHLPRTGGNANTEGNDSPPTV